MTDDEATNQLRQPPCVVLVAHGATDSPGAGASLRRLAEKLRLRADLDAVEAAFIHGEPDLATVLRRSDAARDLCVVPMFAGEGHHTRHVVATAIAAAQPARPSHPIRQVAALGLHPAYARSLAARLRRLVVQAGIDAAAAACLTLGHGSRRAPIAEDAARRLAELLRPEFASSQALYLDGEPAATSWPLHVAQADVVIAPIFFSDASHARIDVRRVFALPEIAADHADAIAGPWIRSGHRLWCAALPPVSDCVADIVADLACGRHSAPAPTRPNALPSAVGAP